MRIPKTLLLLAIFLPAAATGKKPQVTHGVASGDVSATSAVIWARASAPAEMIVEVDADPGFEAARTARSQATAASDLTAQVALGELVPGTLYHYRVTFEDATGRSEPARGSFQTAPDATVTTAVNFVVGGDVGGQGFCRHVERGYDIFHAMADLKPDFFVANGDMIYADNLCLPEGPGGWPNIPGHFRRVDAPAVDWQDLETVREVYLAHWRYNRADRHSQAFLRQVPIYAQWDDHEVINDFGAPWESWSQTPERAGYPNLVRAGRDALFAWNPIARNAEESERIYRSFRWGRDVELFLLDARSYRSLNDLSVRSERPKAMLGQAQLDWLIEGLTDSDATWKIVSSDVPLSVPTGSQAELYGRDGFADGNHPWEAPDFAARTGFERELLELLNALDRADVRNLVFVVTDVHFAMNLRYHPDLDGDGDVLLFHELLSGPMNAGSNPVPPALDPTLAPIVLYTETNFFNFSHIRVERRDGRAVLTAAIRDTAGEARFGSRLELTAEPAPPTGAPADP